jgi:hypothetical protein
MADHALDTLLADRYPEPDEYHGDVEDYFRAVTGNERLPLDVRLKAANALGALDALRGSGQASLFLMMNLAYEDAIQRYKRSFPPASGNDERPRRSSPMRPRSVGASEYSPYGVDEETRAECSMYGVEGITPTNRDGLMGPIRRTINFALAIALSAVGISSSVFLLFFAGGWKGWMVMASGSVAFVGLYWLWADFINVGSDSEN